MARGVQWVSEGRIRPPPDVPPSPAEERLLLQRHGMVKIAADETGTTLRWSMFSANWSSLFFVAEWVNGATGPFHLQYNCAGWFNERYEHAREASARILHLIHKSDVQLVPDRLHPQRAGKPRRHAGPAAAGAARQCGR